MAAYLPPGWPTGVHPPGSDDFEATAVAWMTPFPLLFLPVLFQEKVAAAQQHFERAQSVRVRSRKILADVV